jgi:hypothetical protein
MPQLKTQQGVVKTTQADTVVQKASPPSLKLYIVVLNNKSSLNMKSINSSSLNDKVLALEA